MAKKAAKTMLEKAKEASRPSQKVPGAFAFLLPAPVKQELDEMIDAWHRGVFKNTQFGSERGLHSHVRDSGIDVGRAAFLSYLKIREPKK